MKQYILGTIFFLLGLSTVLGFQYLRSKQTSKPVITTQESASTPQPTFALLPPAQAISGMITATSGHVEKLSRTDNDYKEATTGARILTGESVATKENSSATATVEGFLNTLMGQNAELVFANLFPTNFVLQQKNGKIDYLAIKPISVRALHVLVEINPGETVINVIDTDMSVTVKKGSVKFALVDNNNNTGVWNLKSGERANIDDTASQVYLVPAK